MQSSYSITTPWWWGFLYHLFVHLFLRENSDFYLFVASEEREGWRLQMKQEWWTEQISLEGRDFYFLTCLLGCVGASPQHVLCWVRKDLPLQCLHCLAVARWLRSWAVWTYLLSGLWDLSSPTRDWTHAPGIARWILNHWPSREVPDGCF